MSAATVLEADGTRRDATAEELAGELQHQRDVLEATRQQLLEALSRQADDAATIAGLRRGLTDAAAQLKAAGEELGRRDDTLAQLELAVAEAEAARLSTDAPAPSTTRRARRTP